MYSSLPGNACTAPAKLDSRLDTLRSMGKMWPWLCFPNTVRVVFITLCRLPTHTTCATQTQTQHPQHRYNVSETQRMLQPRTSRPVSMYLHIRWGRNTHTVIGMTQCTRQQYKHINTIHTHSNSGSASLPYHELLVYGGQRLRHKHIDVAADQLPAPVPKHAQRCTGASRHRSKVNT